MKRYARTRLAGIRNYFYDFLTLSSSERRGVIVLLALLVLLIIARSFLPRIWPEKSMDTSRFEKEIAAFTAQMVLLDRQEADQWKKKNGSRTYVPYDTSGKENRKTVTFMIGLNSADTLDLQRLSGIGPAYARRIVRYRERLGGFADKKQLLEIFGMDTSKYNRIAEHLYVEKDSIHKININKITFKELQKHPYFPFELAKGLILYRDKVKRFNSPDDLKKLQWMTDSLYRKILDYVVFE